MFTIRTYNNLSSKGLELFSKTHYQVGADFAKPEAIICRSADLHALEFNSELLAMGRAGAGVNNIPVARATGAGIVVINTPGANANAVKELVITGLLLASRHICDAWNYACQLSGDDEHLEKEMEANKKRFKGIELPGRTLGVIGLGHIGVKVANAALALGMKVIGFDPGITIRNAWELSPQVKQADSIEEVCKHAEFLTVHVPLVEQTKHLMNATRLKLLPPGAVVLNFARNGIVDNEAILNALNSNHISAYVNDFPLNTLKNHPKVITLPHLGASTHEAEENCAVMIAESMIEFLQHGHIENSVNFPTVKLARMDDTARITIINRNVPNMVAQISSVLAQHKHNIVDMINKSRADMAYNIIDVAGTLQQETLTHLLKIDGIVKVRHLS